MTLKQRIMVRIYALWFARVLKRPLTLELSTLAALAATFLATVSVPSVMENLLSSPSAYFYLRDAFSHTGHFIQFLLLLLAVAALYVSRNLVPGRFSRLRFS